MSEHLRVVQTPCESESVRLIREAVERWTGRLPKLPADITFSIRDQLAIRDAGLAVIAEAEALQAERDALAAYARDLREYVSEQLRPGIPALQMEHNVAHLLADLVDAPLPETTEYEVHWNSPRLTRPVTPADDWASEGAEFV